MKDDDTAQQIPAKYSDVQNVRAYQENPEPGFRVTFEKDLTITPFEDNNLYRIGGLGVDNKGRIFISDGNQIKIFDQQGDFVEALGGKGRGPGEFDNMSMLIPKIAQDHLYVYDNILRRINVYDINTLEFTHAIRLQPHKWGRESGLSEAEFHTYFAYSDSLLIAGFKNTSSPQNDEEELVRYYLMDHEGAIVSDKIFEHPYSYFYDGIGPSEPVQINPDVPFPTASDRTTLVDITQSGNIYSMWTEDIFIEKYSIDNVRQGAIYYPFENSRLDESDIISSYESNRQLQKRAQQETYPDTWPAVHQLIVDTQSRLWIATITDDEENYDWWVLDEDGALLGQFKWAGKRLERHKEPNEVKLVRGDYLYAIEENEETEVRQVVRYQIEFNKK